MPEVKRMTDLELLDAVINSITSVPDSCCFWACPGPDARPVHMATCVVCWGVRDLRTLRARLARKVSERSLSAPTAAAPLTPAPEPVCDQD
jgi:hypothetical protein